MRAKTLSLFTFVSFIVISCSPSDNTPNPYGLTADIQGSPSIERTWVEPTVEKIATLSSGEEYTLFSPILRRILDDGTIHIFDFGDTTLKTFTPDGRYIATYGRGKGQGPGQVSRIYDSGRTPDSLVYLVDRRQRKASFFRQKTGEFVRSNKYKSLPLKNFVWAAGSRKYALTGSRTSPFMTIWSSGRQLSVSQITMRDLHSFAFEGTLHALQNQVVYVPLNFPVVMTFSPSDTTGTAYPTPDYGDPRPKVQTTDNGRTFAPTTHMNRDATLHNGMLTVRKPTPDVDSIAFDLYDANDMSYEHSIRFPYDLRRGDRAMHAHGRVLAIARDTTVALYRVHHPEQ